MVREFKLVNEKGQEYSLMDIENYCLLSDPEGLGYSYSTEYELLGNTFITNLRKLEKGEISGTVNFTNYDNYTNLVDFIEASERLRFLYKIPYKNKEIKTFYKNVQIQSLTKTQKQTNGILSETITFDCLSLWYEENSAIFTITPEENEIRWDFEWDSRFTDYDTRDLEYVNTGHVEAPIVAEIDGNVLNPRVELYIDGELYQTVEVTTTIAEYEKLIYNSRENEFEISRQKTDGTIESLFDLDYIEFAKDKSLVIRIPKNKSCRIRMTGDNEVLNAKLTIYPQYKAI